MGRLIQKRPCRHQGGMVAPCSTKKALTLVSVKSTFGPTVQRTIPTLMRCPLTLDRLLLFSASVWFRTLGLSRFECLLICACVWSSRAHGNFSRWISSKTLQQSATLFFLKKNKNANRSIRMVADIFSPIMSILELERRQEVGNPFGTSLSTLGRLGKRRTRATKVLEHLQGAAFTRREPSRGRSPINVVSGTRRMTRTGGSTKGTTQKHKGSACSAFVWRSARKCFHVLCSDAVGCGICSTMTSWQRDSDGTAKFAAKGINTRMGVMTGMREHRSLWMHFSAHHLIREVHGD